MKRTRASRCSRRDFVSYGFNGGKRINPSLILKYLSAFAKPIQASVLSYRFDPERHDGVRLARGDLVAVPFGRRRRVLGLVTGVSGSK